MTADETTEAASLAALAAETWDRYLAAHPEFATAIGDRRFDDRLRANGRGALAAEAEQLDDDLRRAEAIDPALLSSGDAVTRSALLDVLGYERDLALAGIDAWAVDPLDGPQVTFLNIPSFQPVRDRHEAEALAARWAAMAGWVDRHVETSRDALAQGIGGPAALVRSVVAELNDLLARPVAEWPLMDPAGNLPADLAPADRDRLAAAIRSSVERDIRPAFARYRAFLVDELAPVARSDDQPGMLGVPGGADGYARVVRAHTTLELSPDEIHRIGLAETDRIDAEFADLGREMFGTGDRRAVIARLRSDPDLHFRTGAEVRAVAEATLARANAAIPKWFGRLPRADCVVVEIPEHEARHSTIAYYREPAADGSRPGSYYVNTTEPATRPRYEAEVLGFHEAVPGHHLQIAIAQELADLPAFRRYAGPTAFIEGWGLYTERLSAEMGLYSGPLDRFGVISFDAWRASRLVVDTGLHALGWSRDAAIAFMLDHTALAENNIVNEVDRYLALPGQALAYKLGQLEIRRLREDARAALGDRFDIRAFHDVVLGQGAVGLGTLASIVDDWLRASDGSPDAGSPSGGRTAGRPGPA
ncbi:MAG TPA: DUF885 domain-containing protein [Candidatus Limnocylindrales bacterium]|nr:DUF885 domain-containing protein [Candidatus Limnocylindrales bacterium]